MSAKIARSTSKPLSFLLCALLSLVLGWGTLPAQTSGSAKEEKKILEIEVKNLEKEIAIINKLLKSTREKKEKSLGELKLLQQQIVLREQMVMSLNKEFAAANKQVEEVSGEIDTLITQIKAIQAEYGRIAYTTYKASSKKPQAFYLFSAGSVNEGFNRLRYFREFSSFQATQLDLIKRSKTILEKKRLELEAVKLEKERLLNKARVEKRKLSATRKAKDELYKKLKSDEKQFKQDLSDKEKRIRELKKRIREIIEKETVKTDFKADILLPLSVEFKENKGKIPWPMPTSKGVITAKFGTNMDAGGLKWDNNGVDISTTEGQPIRAVFAGEVVQSLSVPHFGKLIVVKHGAYYTVYTHLAESTVKKGDQVGKLQQIGTAKTDKSSEETKVHFEVWLNKDPVNPEDWIVKKR